MSLIDVFGGAVGGLAAAVLTHPIDVLRIREQLRSPIQPTRHGPRSAPTSSAIPPRAKGNIYRGLTAAVARETLYCGVKLGLYLPLRDQLESVVPSSSGSKVVTATLSGATATLLSHPLDLVRVVAVANDKARYPAIVRNLVAERQLWRAGWVALQRSVVFSATQLTAYDITKEWLTEELDGVEHHTIVLLAAWAAGVVSTLVSTPVEVVKTRLQAAPYNGTWDCVRCIGKYEGIRAFWRGGLLVWLRLGPYTLAQMVFWEASREWFSQLGDASLSKP